MEWCRDLHDAREKIAHERDRARHSAEQYRDAFDKARGERGPLRLPYEVIPKQEALRQRFLLFGRAQALDRVLEILNAINKEDR